MPKQEDGFRTAADKPNCSLLHNTQECPITDINEREFLIRAPDLLEIGKEGWYMLFGQPNVPEFFSISNGEPEFTPKHLAFRITKEAIRTRKAKDFYAWLEAQEERAKELNDLGLEPEI